MLVRDTCTNYVPPAPTKTGNINWIVHHVMFAFHENRQPLSRGLFALEKALRTIDFFFDFLNET